jgi:PPP family 3-phenylpropionic acid transporter
VATSTTEPWNASPALAMSVVWFFVLGGLGSFFPFYSLYLRDNLSLSGTQVGLVLSVLPLVGILAQPLWGQIADVTGWRTRVLSVLALGAACGYAALVLGGGFASMLLLTALLAVFSTPLIPSSVAVTLALTSEGGARAFGLVRVWGTVGFLISVVAFPRLLDALRDATDAVSAAGGVSEPLLGWMFPVTAALVAVGGVVAASLPRTGTLSLRAPRGDWRQLFDHMPYVRLLVFALLAYLLLQGPMALFPVYVRAHGGSVETVSALWVPMLLVEIPLVALSGTSLERLGARGLLGVGVFAGGLRWAVCGFLPDSPLVYPVQALHGVVVAGLVLGGPLYVEAAVPERLRSTGQNVLAMVGVSLGGISSNVSSGWLLERFGTDAPYQAAGVGGMALGVLVWILLPRPSRPDACGDSPG